MTDVAESAQPAKGAMSVLRDNPYLAGLAAFASLGGFLFGYDQGVVSGVLTMQSFAALFPRIYLDASFKGWFVSSLLLAAFAGSLINGPVADMIGRKRSIIVAVIIFTIGSAIQAGGVTIEMLFAGRIIAGIAVGMLTMIVPMYISEVSAPEIRGTLVVMQQLSITLGILLSYWIEYGTQYIGGVECLPGQSYTDAAGQASDFNPRQVGPGGCHGQSEASWRLPFAIQIAPALLLGIGMLFYPESPRFYIMKQFDEKALAVLAALRRLPASSFEVQEECRAIKAEHLFEIASNAARHPGKSGLSLYIAQYGSLFSSKASLRRLGVGCGIMFFQQFMGANALIYYAPTIFEQLGLSGKTAGLLATGVYGIVNTLSTLPAVFFIDRLGRRPLLMSGATGTFASLVIIGAIVGAYGSDLPNHKSAGWAAIAFVYIYDVNFSYSFAPIGWVLPSEIFALDGRAKAMSFTTSTTWLCNFVIGLVTPDMLENLGWGTYIFFAAFCLLGLLFAIFCVPETRGKSLEDMDAVFGDNQVHEEKQRMANIDSKLGLTADVGVDGKQGRSQTVEFANQV